MTGSFYSRNCSNSWVKKTFKNYSRLHTKIWLHTKIQLSICCAKAAKFDQNQFPCF